MFNDGIDTLHEDGVNLDPEAPGLIMEATSGCKSEEAILGGNGKKNHKYCTVHISTP